MTPTINDLLLAGLQSSDTHTVTKFQEFSIYLGHEFSEEEVLIAMDSHSASVRAFAIQHKPTISQIEILNILIDSASETKIALSRREDILLTDEHFTKILHDSDPLVVMAFIKRKSYFPTSEHVTLAATHKNFSVRCFFEKWNWMTS